MQTVLLISRCQCKMMYHSQCRQDYHYRPNKDYMLKTVKSFQLHGLKKKKNIMNNQFNILLTFTLTSILRINLYFCPIIKAYEII